MHAHYLRSQVTGHLSKQVERERGGAETGWKTSAPKQNGRTSGFRVETRRNNNLAVDLRCLTPSLRNVAAHRLACVPGSLMVQSGDRGDTAVLA